MQTKQLAGRRRRPTELKVGDIYEFDERCKPRRAVIELIERRGIYGRSDNGLLYRLTPKFLNTGRKVVPCPPSSTAEKEQLAFPLMIAV